MVNNYNHNDFVAQSGIIQNQNIQLYPTEKFEKKAEKDILYRRANWMGAHLLFVQLFGAVASLIAMIVLAIIGWNNGKGGVFGDAVEYIIYSPLSLALPAIIAARACKLKVSEIIPFKKVSFSTASGLFFVGFFALAIGGMLSDIVAYIFPTSINFLTAVQPSTPTNTTEVIVDLLYSAAIPALVEEFTFRGVMMGSLRRYGDHFAVWFSAIMFALVHGNIIQISVALPAGVFLGYLTVFSGNIWVSVALHFANNAIACFSGDISEFLASIMVRIFGNITVSYLLLLINVVFYGIYILIGIVGIKILKNQLKKTNKKLEINKGTVTCLTRWEKFKGIYLSPTVIVAIIFYVGQSLLLLFPAVAEFFVQ